MYRQVTVVGNGAMGTVCALLLAENGLTVRLWGRDANRCHRINETHQNEKYLPGCVLPSSVVASADPEWVLSDTELVVSAVPCQFTRSVWNTLRAYIPNKAPLVSVTKGIELSTMQRPIQVLSELCGQRAYAMLSGPSIAHEIASKMPATVVVASEDLHVAEQIQEALNTPYFRVYTNDDLVGVEISGAVKNIIAIAAGIIDGLQLGDNAKAALVTRGVVEISRLGMKLGAKPETFSGLAGVGDLITTCVSPHGRNRTAGERLGKGESLDHIISTMQSVVEGVPTTRSVVELARLHHVEMPIVSAVHRILFERISPREALNQLMNRELKSE